MNTRREITKKSELLGKSVEEGHPTNRFNSQYAMADQFNLTKEKKMRFSKKLAGILGACLVPITGLVFMQKADAYKVGLGEGAWPTKAAPGECTSFINVSSSGRDTWYWEVECGRNASRKAYLAAKKACNHDFEMRTATHYEPFATNVIDPYTHNKCY